MKKLLASVLSLTLVATTVATPLGESISTKLVNTSISANAGGGPIDDPDDPYELKYYNGFTYYESDGITIDGYDGDATDLVIPSEIDGITVTQIGSNAFRECNSLKKVTIPGTIWEIHTNAFRECENIEELILEEGIDEIYQYAFVGLKSLKHIQIPVSVNWIGERAFGFDIEYGEEEGDYDYTYIDDFTMDVYEDSTGYYYADEYSINYNTMSRPEYEYDFYENDTIEITKYNGSETELEIPAEIDGKKVVSIGYNAFSKYDDKFDEDRSNLKSVIIPGSVTRIRSEAFKNCPDLANITIPSSVKFIEEGAFKGTEWLENKQDEDPLVIVNGILIDGTKCKGNVTIPDNVTNIVSSAFRNCKKLTSVTMPNSVTSIGYSAFYNCTNLTNVKLSNSVKWIDNYTFSNCTSLTSVIIPNGVTSIGYATFRNCRSLTKILIPNSVTYSENAFDYCTSLKDIYYAGSEFQWNNIEIIEDFSDKTIHFNHTHSYTSKVTKQPTCTTTGVKTFTCSCGDSYTEKIPATGHKYVDTVVKPTYTEKGYTLHKCSVCGDEYKDNYTAKLVLANVTGFKASSTSANAVKLTWKKSSGANGYVVYRYNTSTKKYGRIAKITSNTYTDKKLKSGTNYKYAVRAYRTVNGKELLSPSYPQITTSTNPATVSFKLTTGTKKATVKWSKVTGASGYKIYYKTSKNGKWIGLKTVNNKTTSYTKTKLASKKTYYFTVKAYRTTGGKTYNGAYTTKSVKIK